MAILDLYVYLYSTKKIDLAKVIDLIPIAQMTTILCKCTYRETFLISCLPLFYSMLL